MERTLRVAAVQLSATDDLQRLRRQTRRLVRLAAEMGAHLAVLPEFFDCYGPFERIVAAAEPIPGPRSRWLCDLAAEERIALCGGSVPEQSGVAGRIHNTSLVIDSTGVLRGSYRKMHCFDIELPARGERPAVSSRESDHVIAGDSTLSLELLGARIGVAICYDLRFPELFRRLASDGVELLLVPAAFTSRTGRDHWELLVRARAVENQAFVVAANQVGAHAPGMTSHGHSLIVDPWGTPLAAAADREGLVIADLSPDRLTEVRTSLPALRHRRL